MSGMTSRYAFQSPSISDEKGAYRIHPPRSSRPGSNLRPHSEPPESSHLYLHVPYRRTRRIAILVVFLAFGTFACFACAYWLFATRYSHLSLSRTTFEELDLPLTPPHALYHNTTAHHLDITFDILDEPDTVLGALRADPTATFLAYLPHSGLHNQRIALENALTLARLLNRTLLIPPARLGPKTLRYVRSTTLARMLRLSDKRLGLGHCAHIPVDVPRPDECVDYTAYTLVPWAWLVNLGPIEAHQALVRTSNGTSAWMEERLGIGPNDTRFVFDTEPYEYQFVDTPAPLREGKYLGAIAIDTLAAAPERLVQLGTLFGSSRLRLRKVDNRRVRSEVRRQMVFSNPALTFAAKRIGQVLGRAYVAAHVRVGDGRFQEGAQANVRRVWWKLVRDVAGLDTQTALWLERRVLLKIGEVMTMNGGTRGEENEDDDDESDVEEIFGPPEISPDLPSLRVPHPPLSPLPDAFSPKLSCRNKLHTMPSLRRLNVPLFVATDAPDGLDNPLLAPLKHAFPCTFALESFTAETGQLKMLRNGYDGVPLAGFVAPIVEALVMGGAWAMVGTEGSTFSRYVGDVLWRVSHGWEIVQRG